MTSQVFVVDSRGPEFSTPRDLPDNGDPLRESRRHAKLLRREQDFEIWNPPICASNPEQIFRHENDSKHPFTFAHQFFTDHVFFVREQRRH